MGLLDKMKNLFTDEVEEPIKSEVIQVEIPAPTKEEIKPKIESELPKSEPKETKEEKNAPIFFDDEYFKELEQPKKEVKSSYLKEQTKVKEEKKHFKPTPIISPVYGVLDKNYNKEDITHKKEAPITYTSTRISIDEVRKKAYGTLEDDLEDTLVGNNSILFNDETKNDDLFDELIDETKEKKEESIDIIDDDINMIDEEMTEKKDAPITESELFDLIDSMYEKGDK